MIDFESLDNVISKVHKEWKTLIKDVEADFNRYLSVFDVFKEVSSVLNLKQYNYPLMISNIFDKFHNIGGVIVCPGVPGSQEKTYEHLSRILFEISAFYSNISESINLFCLPEFLDDISNDLSVLQKLKSNVDAFYMVFTIERQQTDDNFKSLTMLKENIDQLFLKKEKKKVKTEMQNYAFLAAKVRKKCLMLNLYAEKYISLVKSASSSIKTMQNKISGCAIQFLYRYVEVIRGFSFGITKCFDSIIKPRTDLMHDLREFILYNKIARTRLKFFEPTDVVFTFQDVALMSKITRKNYLETDAPLSIGVAKFDFTGENINELSVKEGQEIYLYETPVDQWVLASDTPFQPKGFVPVKCIELKKLRFAISSAIRIPIGDDGFLPLSSGQLIIVNSNKVDDDILECRDLKGNTGHVYREDIVIE